MIVKGNNNSITIPITLPIKKVENAWKIKIEANIQPITHGNKDIYVIPYQSSGYAGGAGGQLQNFNYITIITEKGSNKVVTAFPSGSTPPLPKNYEFNFGVTYEPRVP